MRSSPAVLPEACVSVADAVASRLVEAGVDHVFGVPATHTLSLIDSFRRQPGVRMIATRTEAGGVGMADGFARASGRIGVSLSSTGPGALNGLGALCTASGDGSPVLNIVTDVPRRYAGLNAGFVHQVDGQLEACRAAAGWARRVERAEEMPPALEEALDVLGGRFPRATVLEVPFDLFDEPAGPWPGRGRPELRSPTPNGPVAAAAAALAAATRPLMLIAEQIAQPGCAARALEIAELLGAAIVLTPSAKGQVSEDHPLYFAASLTFSEIREYVESCDAVLAIGDALTPADTDYGRVRLPSTLVQVAERPRNVVDYAVSHGLSPLPEALDALAQALRTSGVCPKRPATELAATRQALHERALQVPGGGLQIIEALRSALPPETIVCHDVTIAGYWGWHFLPMSRPRTYLYPWRHAAMGFGLPAAIGARLAQPGTPVVLLCGDGGFLSALPELATAAQEGVSIVVVIVDNQGFGVIRERQRHRFGADAMSQLVSPDFVGLARSFNLQASRVDAASELPAALELALAQPTTTILVLAADPVSPFGL